MCQSRNSTAPEQTPDLECARLQRLSENIFCRHFEKRTGLSAACTAPRQCSASSAQHYWTKCAAWGFHGLGADGGLSAFCQRARPLGFSPQSLYLAPRANCFGFREVSMLQHSSYIWSGTCPWLIALVAAGSPGACQASSDFDSDPYANQGHRRVYSQCTARRRIIWLGTSRR